ncbi:neurobeachin-like isoform X2 [Coccinella septempunctata]|uniref:neurobeachin-like isoform X2 n=1 Tax=Coccinella septempunctata TaxID=41139 RepID=UPI001D091BD8|nr:neurobeachin-like isoform X2 [Coccinella septempunctata]
MPYCFICKGVGDLVSFTTYNYEKCQRMCQFRRAKGFKYADLEVPNKAEGRYHPSCYRKFVVLKDKYRKEYEKMFNVPPKDGTRRKTCLFCGKGQSVLPLTACTRKMRDATKKQAEILSDNYLLKKLDETPYLEYHFDCKTHFEEKCRRFIGLQDDYSMPLQQRLTAISSAQEAPEPEKPVQTLKSQPLSPTKLKVTRQSTSRSQQQQQQKPAGGEVQEPVKEEICLKWNTHHSNMQTAFPALLNKEQYCDVTLVAEGVSLKCHKLILSSCSSYFDEVLEKVVPYQHPIIFMKDIPFNIMKALCDFMYVGEVNIVQSDLDQILAVGNSLKIKGLASRSEVKNPPTDNDNNTSEPQKIPTKQSKAGTKPTVSEKNAPVVDDVDITDPLDLMEPTYEEAATPDVPAPVLKRNDQARKSTGRRVRKRKHVEVDHEPSPPVFRMRKGTRSRPNVKVPRYFNANFDNSAPAPAPEPPEYPETIEQEESYIDSYMNILEHIKTEPLDIEDGLISFEEESFNLEMSNTETDVGQLDQVPQSQETLKVVKKRKLSRTSARAKLENPDPLRDVVHDSEKHTPVGETTADTCERVESQEEGSYREEISGHNDTGGSIDEERRDEFDTQVETEGMHIENSDEMELEKDSNDQMQTENSEEEEINTENPETEEINTENTDKEETGVENIEIQVENDNQDIMNIENNDNSGMSKIVENESENSDTQNSDEVTNINQVEINSNHETQVDSTIGEEGNVEDEISEIGKGENCCHEIRIENSYTDDAQENVCEYEGVPGREDDVEAKSDAQEDGISVEKEQSTSVPEETTEFDECNIDMENIVVASTEEKSIDDKTQENDSPQEGILTNSTIEEESNNS